MGLINIEYCATEALSRKAKQSSQKFFKISTKKKSLN